MPTSIPRRAAHDGAAYQVDDHRHRRGCRDPGRNRAAGRIAIDPTGIGRTLKLTQMGEIKEQLAIEAEADRQRDRHRRRRPLIAGRASWDHLPACWSRRRSAPQDDDDDEVAPRIKASQSVAQPAPGAKTDETMVTLKPNEGVEYKMTIVRGAVVQYSWTTNGGNVNYDLHGSPKGGGKETSYKKGREVASDSGTLTAA